MDRGLYPARDFGNGLVRAYARIALAGAATTVVPTFGKEWIKSIAHVGGTNIWTVTLTDKYPQVLYCDTPVRDDASNGAYATAGSFTGESSTTGATVTFKINTFNASGTVLNDSTLVVGLEIGFLNTVSMTAGN